MSMKVVETTLKTIAEGQGEITKYTCVLEGYIKGVAAKLTLKSLDISELNEIVLQRIHEDVDVQVRSFNTSLDSFSNPANDILDFEALRDSLQKRSDSLWHASDDATDELQVDADTVDIAIDSLDSALMAVSDFVEVA